MDMSALRNCEHMAVVVADCIRLIRAIEILRADEGATLIICCDNPIPENDKENNKIVVCDAWTNWVEKDVWGESLLECLESALEQKEAIDDV